MIVRALKRYLPTEGAGILAIAEGRREVATGDAHDMDVVTHEVEKVIRTGRAAG